MALMRAALAELKESPGFSLESRLRTIEGAYIAAAQAIAAGNLSQTAKLLGLSRTTLYHRLAVLERDQTRPR
jgi:transcriptional regulator of acetoin/glycerol metabolism